MYYHRGREKRDCLWEKVKVDGEIFECRRSEIPGRCQLMVKHAGKVEILFTTVQAARYSLDQIKYAIRSVKKTAYRNGGRSNIDSIW